MRPVVVIILVIALTIQLFEEALSKITRPKLKKIRVKKPRTSKSKSKMTRIKHSSSSKTKIKASKKPAVAATDTHSHHGHGGLGGLYVAQTTTDSVAALGNTGAGITGVVLQSQAGKNDNKVATEGEQVGEENNESEQ
nr:uncharacterized protein LOC119166801 isoform X1 [Rhipicephalus microplus]